MKKKELIEKIAYWSGFNKKEVTTIVNQLFNEIVKALENKEKVEIPGFGQFVTKHKPAHMGFNPRFKEKVEVEARTYPRFKASTRLKKTLKDI